MLQISFFHRASLSLLISIVYAKRSFICADGIGVMPQDVGFDIEIQGVTVAAAPEKCLVGIARTGGVLIDS